MLRVFRLLLIVGAVFSAATRAPAAPHYEVGDIATNTVVTPVALVVRDPVATALLQAKEERAIRTVVRYSPTVADEVERAFRSRMALVREEFLKQLQAEYGRSKIEKGLERTPKWLELTGRFREEYKGTPKLFLYVPYWAQGRSDEHLLADWIGYLRRAMNKPLRPDRLPSGNIGTTVRLVTVPDLETEVELDHAERYGVLTPLDNLVPLSLAAREMAAEFPEGDGYIADFLAPFLKPNCVFDEELTRLARERRVDSLIVADNYAAGDTLVRVGQVVDAKAVAAIEELRKQMSRTSESGGATPAREDGDEDRTFMWWVIGGGGGGALLIVCILLVRRRSTGVSVDRSMVPRRDSRASLPVRTRGAEEGVTVSPDRLSRLEGESEREWRERALAAEMKAEKAKELARSSVTKALKDKVVEHLSSQRNELIDNQESAADQMAELEARLERIQGPLSERLRAYERRIAELEEELAVKDEENRALIRAKIQTLRERMAREKAGRAGRMFDLN